MEAGMIPLEVYGSRFAGLPKDNVTKVLFSIFHFD